MSSLYPVRRSLPGEPRRSRSEGRRHDEILAEIERDGGARGRRRYHEGQISGSIYSGDDEHYEFLNEVFGYYSHANVLQRDMYPSATKFEGEIIAMTADMLHGDAAEPTGGTVCGVITSGGTESLMTPLLVYREWGRERGITRPNVVMPVTAHPALRQGRALLRHRAAQGAGHGPTSSADVDAMAALDRRRHGRARRVGRHVSARR